jgi:hypothetical protein
MPSKAIDVENAFKPEGATDGMNLLNEQYAKIEGNGSLEFTAQATAARKGIPDVVAKTILNIPSVIRTTNLYKDLKLGPDDLELGHAIVFDKALETVEGGNRIRNGLKDRVDEEMQWLSHREIVKAFEEFSKNPGENYRRAEKLYSGLKNGGDYVFETAMYVLKKTFEDFYVKSCDVPEEFVCIKDRVLTDLFKLATPEERRYNEFIGALRKNADLAMSYLTKEGVISEVMAQTGYDKEFSESLAENAFFYARTK